MSYQVIYDLAEVGFREQPTLLLAAGIALAGLALHAWQRRRGRRSPTARVLCGFGALIALFGGALPYWDQQRPAAALHEGRARVAEGPVSGHYTQVVTTRDWSSSSLRYHRHTWEAFNVGAVAFGYYRDRSAVGFRNAEDKLLELRDGMALKLHYIEDVEGDFAQRRIVRVELHNRGDAS